jgi:cold shock protein
VATGVVKWFNLVMGYAMLQPDDGSPAVLVDSGAVERAGLAGLRKGQRVACDVVFEHRRNAATNLKPLRPRRARARRRADDACANDRLRSFHQPFERT